MLTIYLCFSADPDSVGTLDRYLTPFYENDIKVMENEKHKQYTGSPNKLILENLIRLLKTNSEIWVRIPIVPGVNDTEEQMKKIEKLKSCIF